jgi:hypothetical protein
MHSGHALAARASGPQQSMRRRSGEDAAATKMSIAVVPTPLVRHIPPLAHPCYRTSWTWNAYHCPSHMQLCSSGPGQACRGPCEVKACASGGSGGERGRDAGRGAGRMLCVLRHMQIREKRYACLRPKIQIHPCLHLTSSIHTAALRCTAERQHHRLAWLTPGMSAPAPPLARHASTKLCHAQLIPTPLPICRVTGTKTD